MNIQSVSTFCIFIGLINWPALSTEWMEWVRRTLGKENGLKEMTTYTVSLLLEQKLK